MKILFKAIRQGNMDEVKRILDKKPEVVNCTAKAPPKKDEGQSPLQVAIKSDHAEVADYLLDRGADVNFMEDHVYYEIDLRAPVLYDAVMQVFPNSYHHLSEDNVLRCEKYFSLICRLLEMGADPNKEASCGSRAWNWVLLQYLEHMSDSLEERKKTYIVELTTRLLEQLATHGTNCFYKMFGYDACMRKIVLNLGCNRGLMDGLIFENESDEERYCWLGRIEPILRPYYAKESPYYNEAASEQERKQFRQKLEQEIEDAEIEAERRWQEALEYRERMGMLSTEYYKRMQDKQEKSDEKMGGTQK